MSNEIRDALNSVTRYDDFEDFSYYNGGMTREELQDYINEGWCGELTPGTYNGALDKFDRVTNLTDSDIINAIKTDMTDDDLIADMIETLYPGDNTPDTQVLAYTGIYNVFTIGQRLYVDRDK